MRLQPVRDDAWACQRLLNLLGGEDLGYVWLQLEMLRGQLASRRRVADADGLPAVRACRAVCHVEAEAIVRPLADRFLQARPAAGVRRILPAFVLEEG